MLLTHPRVYKNSTQSKPFELWAATHLLLKTAAYRWNP